MKKRGSAWRGWRYGRKTEVDRDKRGCFVNPAELHRCGVCGLRYDTRRHMDCPACLAEMRKGE